MKNSIRLILILLLAASVSFGGEKYRTFSQFDLAQRKAKPGKTYASDVCFRFYNTTGATVNDLHAKLNAGIIAVTNDGGFPVFDIARKGKEFDASGLSVAPGDSVTICLTIGRKAPGAQVNFWWWTNDGEPVGGKQAELAPIEEELLRSQPNGGNVLQYLYKRVIRRPAGLLVGIPTDTPGSSWIRYMNAQRKAFPHSGDPRCLDFISSGSGRLRAFPRQLRNPHVKKHDNHLVGELHALKLAIVANDSGVSEPLDTAATLFGDLIYNDGLNPGDICNGMTLREIARLADSALTYCGHFGADTYEALDHCIGRVNAAFDGAYSAVSFSPFVLAGAVDLDGVGFMHDNPAAGPAPRPGINASIIEEVPSAFGLEPNYPNPFNPTTTIEFSLAVPSEVTLTVYNTLGEEVATLIPGEVMDDGVQSAEFEANTLPSGVYLYRITASPLEGRNAAFVATRKMIFIK